jgi:hypothetical protein
MPEENGQVPGGEPLPVLETWQDVTPNTGFVGNPLAGTQSFGFGPTSPRASMSRPAPKADPYGAQSWFKDASAPGKNDGTIIGADWLNNLIAQFLHLASTANIGTLGNAPNDAFLANAILAMISKYGHTGEKIARLLDEHFDSTEWQLTAEEITAIAQLVADGSIVTLRDGVAADYDTLQKIRTAILAVQASVNLRATINSPTFTGTPQAPTPAIGDNSQKIATTAFVAGTAFDNLVSSLGFKPPRIGSASDLLGGEEGFAIHFPSRSMIIREDAGVKSASGWPSDLLTITRASTHYARGRNLLLTPYANNALAYHHAPPAVGGGGEARGVRISTGWTNIGLYSEEFDNAAWTKRSMVAFGAGSTANFGVAPDGTTTMDKLVPDTSNDLHHVALAPIAFTPGTTHTQAVYARASGYSRIRLVMQSDTSEQIRQHFNLADGTVGASYATGGATELVVHAPELIGNGLWRFAVSGKLNSGTTIQALVGILNDADETTYAGDGVKGVELWGHTLGATIWPAPYIKTTNASVLQAADVVSMPLSLLPWNAKEGMVAIRARTANWSGAAQTLFAIDDGTTSNRIRIERNSVDASIRCLVAVGGVTQATLVMPIQANDTQFTVAFGWRLNDFAASLNGGAVVTDTLGTVPTGLTQFRIGCNNAGGTQWGGTIEHILYSNRRHSNTDIQAHSY